MNQLTKWKVMILLILFNVVILFATGCTTSQSPNKSSTVKPVSDISFNRYVRSDNWEKNKKLWFSYIDESFWLPLYNQNYFVISGNSQGSKIFAAIGLDRLQRRWDVNYDEIGVPLLILTLYSNMVSINSAGDDVAVTLEPKKAGYDAVEVTRSEMSCLPHKTDADGDEEYSVVFKNRDGVILHQEEVMLSKLGQ